MRTFKTIEMILDEVPGCRGYILQAPAGPSFLWKSKDPAPKGRYVLLAVID